MNIFEGQLLRDKKKRQITWTEAELIEFSKSDRPSAPQGVYAETLGAFYYSIYVPKNLQSSARRSSVTEQQPAWNPPITQPPAGGGYVRDVRVGIA